MRQIKFRGKDTFKSKFFPQRWLYGTPVQDGDDMWMCVKKEDKGIVSVKVDPSTVGQFTGLLDRNGKEIFEGDIVRYGEFIYHVIEFKHGMFGYTLMDGWFVGYGGNTNFTFNPLDKSKEHEVIGNVFDNPELITNQPTEV